MLHLMAHWRCPVCGEITASEEMPGDQYQADPCDDCREENPLDTQERRELEWMPNDDSEEDA